MEQTKVLRGGEFLTQQSLSSEVFIPEEFNEEQLMIAQTCQDFLETEVFPNLDNIDAMEPGLMPSTLKKAGELGLLGISIPEEYEGFGQSFVTSMLSSDIMGAGYSFAVAFSAHTGIGTLPILYYGNHEQKSKYLPKLASGEYLGCYCLTEPNAGSDANSGKTKAVLSEDGRHYVLNGAKMWITNGGFADTLVVFAKIDNDRVLSAFIVERGMPGVSFNVEEKKMGIKGSSTVQIFFNDAMVPVENLLGKRGEGFRIALNILHIGRIKLGANVLGAARRAISQSVNYANERKQFGSLISNFGAIKFKLAEQVIRAFATESAVYRTSQYIDDHIQSSIADGMEKPQAYIEALGEYAIEAAILKVYGSEMLDYVVDEAVQIYGGMGYSAEAPVDRSYRDSRINRIFEGTNEINRMVVIDTIMKKALKGDWDLLTKAKELSANIDTLKPASNAGGYYEVKAAYIENFKKIAGLVLQNAVDTFGRKFGTEQEVMCNISDMVMQLYAAESALLRVQKIEEIKGAETAGIYKDMIEVLIYDAANVIHRAGKDAINSFASGEQQQGLHKALDILCEVAPVNVKEARRNIANKLIDENRYCF